MWRPIKTVPRDEWVSIKYADGTIVKAKVSGPADFPWWNFGSIPIAWRPYTQG
jgi:hypothetical protein